MTLRSYTNGVLTSTTHPGSVNRSLVTREASEVITDDISPGRGVKSCNHTKSVIQRFATSSNMYQSANGVGRADMQGTGSAWYMWIPDASTYSLDLPGAITVNAVYPQTEAQQIANAVHDFYAGSNETQGFENIIESPRLISSMETLARTLESGSIRKAVKDALFVKKKGIFTPLSKLSKKAQIAVLKAQGRTLKRVAGVTSGLYLAYSFGVAPLVSDMVKVSNSIDGLRGQLDAARSSSGKIVSVHRDVTGALRYQNTSGGSEGVSYKTLGGQLEWKLTLTTPPRRVVTVRGYRSQKYNTKVFSSLDYMMRRFGAAGPATLLKEFIPWSFVAEWFLDLRNITDRLDNLLTGATRRIIDVGISEKYGYYNTAELTSSSSYTMLNSGGLLYQGNVSHYHRNPVTSYNTVGLSGRFGKKQATLLGALIHQKMANLIAVR